MSIFVVFRVTSPSQLEGAIKNVFPADYMKVADREWLISATGTAHQVAERLGLLPGGAVGSGIVFSMANYHGLATTEIWDWIKAKAEKTGG